MKIVIASDHAGFALKQKIIDYLEDVYLDIAVDIQIKDMGPFVYNEEDDYPDYIQKVAAYIGEHDASDEYRGIIIGGSGQGEHICANRYAHVRSVLFYGTDRSTNKKIITLSREHNDANVLSIAARFTETDHVLEMIHLWLITKFSNDARHIRRIKKLELHNS